MVLVLCAIATSLLFGPVATPAWAGVEIIQTYPAAGSTIAERVEEVGISFANPVAAELSDLVVEGSDGQRYDDEPLSVVAGRNAIQPVPPLPAGSYLVRWAAGRIPDDVGRGEFRFTVADWTEKPTPTHKTPGPWDGSPSAAVPRQSGHVGTMVCLGAALLGIILFVLLIRSRYKREMDRPWLPPGPGLDR